MLKSYIDYDKKSLIEKIDKISIEYSGNQVVTKFDNRVLSITNVSNKYEIFDIKSYLKKKIDLIEENFKIEKYRLNLSKGIQELSILSTEIEIGEYKFQKSFFILNSSDKSRKLSFNIGLVSKDSKFYMVSKANNVDFLRKHLKGVTKIAEDSILNLNDETFSDQIKCIESLIGHQIKISKVKEILVDDPDININHQKFDAFKNQLLYYNLDKRIKLTLDQQLLLRTPSKRIENIKNDFYLDAFWVFQTYLRIFSNQDSHIIKRETEKIMKITQFSVRNQILENLGI